MSIEKRNLARKDPKAIKGIQLCSVPQEPEPLGMASGTTSKKESEARMKPAENPAVNNETNLVSADDVVLNEFADEVVINEEGEEGDSGGGGGGRNGGRPSMGDVMTVNEQGNPLNMYQNIDYYGNEQNFANNNNEDPNDIFYDDNGNFGDDGLQIVVNGNDTNFFV